MAASVFFASDEWRPDGSIMQPNHQKLEAPQKQKDHITPRGGQPQKRSREARFLEHRAADLLVATSRLQTASLEAE